jgi:hypothetical protein
MLSSLALVVLLLQGARYLNFARDPSGHCEVATIHLIYGLPGEAAAAEAAAVAATAPAPSSPLQQRHLTPAAAAAAATARNIRGRGHEVASWS